MVERWPDWINDVCATIGLDPTDWRFVGDAWEADCEPDGPDWHIGIQGGSPTYINATWGSATVEIDVIDRDPAKTVRLVAAAFAALNGAGVIRVA